MKSKEFELIKEMLQMQAKLDESIMKEYGCKIMPFDIDFDKFTKESDKEKC